MTLRTKHWVDMESPTAILCGRKDVLIVEGIARRWDEVTCLTCLWKMEQKAIEVQKDLHSKHIDACGRTNAIESLRMRIKRRRGR